MRDLLIAVWGLSCGLCLAYSSNWETCFITCVYLFMLLLFILQSKPGSIPLLLFSLGTGFLVAYQYNSFSFEDNKYYVNAVYIGKIGIQDRFSLNGRRLTVENYDIAYGEEPYEGKLRFHEPVRLTGCFHPVPFDMNGEVIHGEKVKLDRRSGPADPLIFLDLFKSDLAVKMKEEIGIESGALAASLVLGIKDSVLNQKTDLLKYLGVIHILSISGFHVNLLEALLRRSPLRRLDQIIILLYAILVNSVPAWRAALMKLSKGAGRLLHRDSPADNQLLTAALIQIFFQPYLLFDRSFQLTYAATAGLIFFDRPIRELLIRFPQGRIKDGIILSLSAMIPCIPFLPAFQPDLNLAMFPANFLIVPFYSLFCLLAFLIIPPLIFKWTWITDIMSVFMDLTLRACGLMEYLTEHFLSLRVSWTGAEGIMLLVILAIAVHAYRLPLTRKIAALAAGCLLLSNLYLLPGTTRILFSKSMGQARVILQKDLRQIEAVTEKMFRRGLQRTAICVETPLEVMGLRLEPDTGDFPGVSSGNLRILLQTDPSSDIIDEEYLIVFGNIIRLK